MAGAGCVSEGESVITLVALLVLVLMGACFGYPLKAGHLGIGQVR